MRKISFLLVFLAMIATACVESNNSDSGQDLDLQDGYSDGVDSSEEMDAEVDLGEDEVIEDQYSDTIPDTQEVTILDTQEETIGETIEDQSQALPVIEGLWHDDFGTTIEVGSESWRMISTWGDNRYLISSVDLDQGWSIVSADAVWSVMEWTLVADQVYFCQSAYGLQSEAEALSAQRADRSSPASSGCGAFAWSALHSGQGPLALMGDRLDNYGTEHTITSVRWSMNSEFMPGATTEYVIDHFDNIEGFLIAQATEDTTYYPGYWNRIDWTWYGGNFWYCQTDFDANSAAEAEATPAADATQPDLAGCNLSPWTRLEAAQ